MSARHVVVDGSNIATEGRSLPSLAQLDEAVREFVAENPDDIVMVVVDASFGHRVDPSELPVFEEAETAGEIVSPPAGAIGRGDAFLLRIAEKVGATVLSNDSFQEFHGEHSWLFDKGRLIGGKPVPGVGWIFMERSPVRGQKSREVVKEAKRKKKEAGDEPSGLDLAVTRTKGRDKKLDRAIARATQEVIQPKDGKSSKRRRAGTPPAEPVNEPLPFITFIAAHPLGSEVVGVVTEFSSHGAFVESLGARCYIPLSAMGDPPPRRAREVLGKGDERTFVVQALDPQRRGIELALPGFAKIAGSPTPETVEAEIHPAPAAKPSRQKAASVHAPAGADSDLVAAAAGSLSAAPAASKATSLKKAAAKKAVARKAAAKKAHGKEVAVKKAEPAKKAAASNKGPMKKAAAPATDAAPKRAAPAKKAGPAKKAAPGKKAEPAKKAAPSKKHEPAKKAAASKKPEPANRAPANRAPAKKAGAAAGTPRKAVLKRTGDNAASQAEPPAEITSPALAADSAVEGD